MPENNPSSDNAPVRANEFFRKSSYDFKGLPCGLRVEMKKLVNRGPTPEVVAMFKRRWAK